MMFRRLLFSCLGLFGFWCVIGGQCAEPLITRVPGDGTQPQALTAPDGTVHLVYYKGEPKGGDLIYVRRPPGSRDFSQPVQVNSVHGSAIALGTIRGAQIALGRNNRIHVAWNGSGKKDAEGMRYARLRSDGAAFEPERNLMTATEGLDGGGSIAADGAGNVYVAWHGLQKSGPKGETHRAVFVAVSRNDGATFAVEHRASTQPLGACACCGLKAYANDKGEVFVLFRSARTESERDETLLGSTDGGQTFKQLLSHRWALNTCPMSSAWIGAWTPNNLIAGWETKGRVWFSEVSAQSQKCSEPFSMKTLSGQKYPSALINAAGDRLFIWTEGAGWQKGGALAWRILDQNGKQVGTGREEDVPVWSFAAAISRPDGTFEIFY